jgi:hypothetical protein
MQHKPTTSRLEALRAAHQAYEEANAEFNKVVVLVPQVAKVVDAAWEKVLLAEAKYSGIINLNRGDWVG